MAISAASTAWTFAVVGPAVNMVSRLERVAKESGETAICSEAFASALPATFTRPIGRFDLKALDEQYNVFAVATD